jgi:hypothetical protein
MGSLSVRRFLCARWLCGGSVLPLHRYEPPVPRLAWQTGVCCRWFSVLLSSPDWRWKVPYQRESLIFRVGFLRADCFFHGIGFFHELRRVLAHLSCPAFYDAGLNVTGCRLGILFPKKRVNPCFRSHAVHHIRHNPAANTPAPRGTSRANRRPYPTICGMKSKRKSKKKSLSNASDAYILRVRSRRTPSIGSLGDRKCPANSFISILEK